MTQPIRRPFHRKPVSRRAVLGAGITTAIGASQLQNTASAANLSPSSPAPLSPNPNSVASRVMGSTSPSGGSVWSGASIPVAPTKEAIEGMAAWRNRPLDVVLTFNNAATMETIADSAWAVDGVSTAASRVSVGVSLISNAGPETLADVAAGTYDSHFARLAKGFAAARPDSIIRLGWEPNGGRVGWYRWQPTLDEVTDFKNAFRRVAGIFRKASPAFRIDLTFAANNQVKGQTWDRVGALHDLYPGDDVVDIVGIDCYDQDAMRADTMYLAATVRRPQLGPGLQDVLDFARGRGKPMSIAEWGVVASWHNGGGDNPAFIRVMRDWIAEHADDIAYEAYFNNWENSPYTMLCDGGYTKSALPASAEAYRTSWNF